MSIEPECPIEAAINELSFAAETFAKATPVTVDAAHKCAAEAEVKVKGLVATMRAERDWLFYDKKRLEKENDSFLQSLTKKVGEVRKLHARVDALREGVTFALRFVNYGHLTNAIRKVLATDAAKETA